MTVSTALPSLNGDTSGKTLILTDISTERTGRTSELTSHRLTKTLAVGSNNHRQQTDVWKHAPVLIGTTKFEPRPDVKNIMITGGAGFM